MKFCVGQRFGQAISNHLGGGHVHQFYLSGRYLILNVIMLGVDMLCFGVENWIVRQGNGALIVAFERDCFFYPPSNQCILK